MANPNEPTPPHDPWLEAAWAIFLATESEHTEQADEVPAESEAIDTNSGDG